jgi:predicted flap endonuclease-1-like 5' DNA nuclease
VWGATTLFVEPNVYRRDADRSILGDLEQGRPGRLLRLLFGGMAIGLTWEALNIGARAKWIYTVPGLEELKLFEMPVLGFFGFPPFALECFVLWQALVLAGLAVPRTPEPAIRFSARRRAFGVIAAGVFSVLVLWGMEGGRTWDSTRPSLVALEGVDAPALRAAGIEDPFELARADADRIAASADVQDALARDWIGEARLATLRGIGVENAARLRAIGITSIDELAVADPDSVIAALRRTSERDTGPARVRVWIRAAREAAGET